MKADKTVKKYRKRHEDVHSSDGEDLPKAVLVRRTKRRKGLNGADFEVKPATEAAQEPVIAQIGSRVGDRFTSATNLIDVDKHMLEYIEGQMKKGSADAEKLVKQHLLLPEDSVESQKDDRIVLPREEKDAVEKATAPNPPPRPTKKTLTKRAAREETPTAEQIARDRRVEALLHATSMNSRFAPCTL